MNAKTHLEMLGMPVADRVTKFEGIITMVSFDLYGCVQAAVAPSVDEKGKKRDGHFFDIARLKKTSDSAILPQPKKSKKHDKYIQHLGMSARDEVTGFTGTIASIAFSLENTVGATITPQIGDSNEKPKSAYFEFPRLTITSEERAMPVPNFNTGPVAEGRHGPAEKECISI